MIIAEKRARIQKELNEIDELYTKREDQDENNDDDGGTVTQRQENLGDADHIEGEERNSPLSEKEMKEQEEKDFNNDANNSEFEPIYDE